MKVGGLIMTIVQNRFISYIEKFVGQPYIWGGTETKMTKANYIAVINKKEAPGINRNNAIKFVEALFEKGATEVYGFDCSGYISKALISSGLRTRRGDCDTLWSKCTRTDKLENFTLLFRVNPSNPNDETHVGVYYNGYQYHAKGRAYGVVKEKYNKRYWHKMGLYPGLKTDYIKPVNPSKPGTSEFEFSHNLKYGSPYKTEVKELKKLLAKKGFDNLDINNGNYRSKTKATVIKFQKTVFSDHKEWDGIAGKRTIEALGGKWIE